MSILIYLFPALIDMVSAQALFANSVRAAQMRCSDVVITGTWAVFGVVYMTVCGYISRRLKPHNALRFLIASCLMLCGLCGLALLARSVAAIYAISALLGLSTALFFPAFQVFMKEVDRGQARSIAYSTGMYTFAWSTGFAAGPFVTGFLMQAGPNGWAWAFAVSALVSLGCAAGFWLLGRRARPAPAAVPPPASAGGATGDAAYAGFPDLAWLGWVGAGAGLMVLSILRALLPAMAVKELGLPEGVQGTVFFLLSMVQALTGLAMCRSRLWMYRPAGVMAFGLFGLAGLVGFIFFRSPLGLCLGAACFGVYTGAFYFYLVFHALAHPNHSARYVSINEVVVGIMSVAGPLLGGVLAQWSGGYTLPMALGAAIVAGVSLFQGAVHARVGTGRPAGGAPAPAAGPVHPCPET